MSIVCSRFEAQLMADAADLRNAPLPEDGGPATTTEWFADTFARRQLRSISPHDRLRFSDGPLVQQPTPDGTDQP